MHLMGRGRCVDWRQCVRCFELSAAGGYAVAQCDLGTLYLAGTPVHAQDLPRALALYTLADDQVLAALCARTLVVLAVLCARTLVGTGAPTSEAR